MRICLNPNCKSNPKACPDFEPPNKCHREKPCVWKKGLNFKPQRERFFTRNIAEVNA